MGLLTAERSVSPLAFQTEFVQRTKARSQKSQPNEAQRILTQLARIHQTCKADALKIFRFPSASASSFAVPSTTFPAARPHIRQYVDEGKEHQGLTLIQCEVIIANDKRQMIITTTLFCLDM